MALQVSIISSAPHTGNRDLTVLVQNIDANARTVTLAASVGSGTITNPIPTLYRNKLRIPAGATGTTFVRIGNVDTAATLNVTASANSGSDFIMTSLNLEAGSVSIVPLTNSTTGNSSHTVTVNSIKRYKGAVSLTAECTPQTVPPAALSSPRVFLTPDGTATSTLTIGTTTPTAASTVEVKAYLGMTPGGFPVSTATTYASLADASITLSMTTAGPGNDVTLTVSSLNQFEGLVQIYPTITTGMATFELVADSLYLVPGGTESTTLRILTVMSSGSMNVALKIGMTEVDTKLLNLTTTTIV